ncbi:MAG TPA: type I DNA topoisomerase [Candidatus Limenecus avicola]|uniref:DNA topoisomerase 1 n=1 Tax=Candidatus Limenecus avicola TaxID=2840847 RepID=A0A9D1SR52_9CLOT|nr:type I DNA topoisomerase [Candidatus Limenecus avicola]
MAKAKTTTKEKTKKEKALVIVESPAKSKTIKKILGDSYQIEASYGHIRDFPPKVLGFDVANDFEPSFIVIPEKKVVVKKLNDLAKKSDKIYLASDPDREGEAIAWHVRQVLEVPDEKINRIEFNEITPKAIKSAVEHPRQIDMERVKAQQTRQILDRLVGYKISPVLWEKMRNYRLSAGRVQSVALRMICEREDEIDAFVPVEYWSITADLLKGKLPFSAELTKYKDKKIEIKNKEEADKIVADLTKKGLKYEVSKVTYRDTQRKPSAPFITSTLQREASSKLGYGVSKTMQIAQKLYEGIEIGGEPVGLITYMRTDSVRISDDAQAAAKDFITDSYGENYYPKTPNNYVKGKGKNVQDAHEAIRPSYIEKTPDSIKQYLTSEQYRLYKLIWSRFIASQMENAKVKNTSVDITADDYLFKTGTSKVIFDGFLKVYNENDDEPDSAKIPDLEQGDELKLQKIEPKQHFTQPPPRFTEASLVKALEEHGIGRPSTYAPIISKIQQKGYVEKLEKALAPTILGRTLCRELIKYFTDIMNYKFTAQMETKLDDIAEEKAVWTDVLKDFYTPFTETVDSAKKNMPKVLIESDVVCPKCGKKMIVRTSRFGTQFLGCSGYPECKTMMPLNKDGSAAPVDEKSDEKCEKCGSEMIVKVGPYGKYLQCTNDECKHRKRIVITTGVKCPKCGEGEIIQRKSKYGKIFYGCNKYPDCDFVSWNEPVQENCPECGAYLVKKITKKESKLVCSNNTCSFSKPLESEEESQNG